MIYSKTYWHDRGDSYTSDWHNYYMSEVSQFLQSIDLVKGTIIEYGCYKGEMLDHLAKNYPDCNIVGVDYYNINNHPSIIETDIKDFNSKFDITLALNDLIDFHKDPESKLAGRNHAIKHLIPGGFYVESSAHPVQHIPGLVLVKLEKYVSFFKRG